MHIQKSYHLVALDKPFSQRFPLFIVQLSILNHSHPLWCLECKTKTYLIPLRGSSRFLFFSFFFSKLELDHHQHLSIFISMDLTLLTHLDCTNLAQITTHDIGQYLGFINQPKPNQGFQSLSFLVIDDNLFTKIFNKILLDSCCLPKHFTMCKGYG